MKNLLSFLKQEWKFITLQVFVIAVVGFIVTVMIVSIFTLSGCNNNKNPYITFNNVDFESVSSGCAVSYRSPSGEHDTKYIGTYEDGSFITVWMKSDDGNFSLDRMYQISGYESDITYSGIDHVIDYNGKTIIIDM